jgi:hypothetical protein
LNKAEPWPDQWFGRKGVWVGRTGEPMKRWLKKVRNTWKYNFYNNGRRDQNTRRRYDIKGKKYKINK